MKLRTLIPMAALLLGMTQAVPQLQAAPWAMSAHKLRKAPQSNARPIGRGATGAKLVDLAAPHKGVLKSSFDQNNVMTGVHEVAAFALSVATGIDFVPSTTKLGGNNTLQLFVEGEDGGAGATADEYQLLLVFDYLIDNGDRHPGNFLVAKADNKLVAIDHSHRTFPGAVKGSGAPSFGLFKSRMGIGVKREIFPTNAAIIAKMKPHRVARALKASGLTVDQIRSVLLRLTAIKAYAINPAADGVVDEVEVEAALVSINAAAKPAAPGPLNVKLTRFAGKGKVANAGALFDAVDPETQLVYQYLAGPQYGELRDVALEVATKYQPTKAYLVGVGRSAAPVAAFLGLLGDNAAGYLPIDGLSKYVEAGQAKPLSAAQLRAFDEVFEAFLPADALSGDRDVVLFQKSDSGDSLRLLRPVLQRWLAAKGHRNQVKIVGMAAVGKQVAQAGLDDLMVFSSATFDAIGTRAFNLVAPYDKFRPGSSKHGPHDVPYDANGRPKAPAPIADKFRSNLEQRMVSDPVLAAWAQAAAK